MKNRKINMKNKIKWKKLIILLKINSLAVIQSKLQFKK